MTLRPPPRPYRALLIAGLAILMSAVACGGLPFARATPTPASAPSLVVYASVDYIKAVGEAFQRDTGIVTTIKQESGGPLLTRVRTEGTSPQWGVLWIDGAAPAAALAGEGLLVRDYRPDAAWADLARESTPAGAGCIPTGVTLSGVAVYDTRELAAPPARWEDLSLPAWRGRVGMANPSISGPAFTTLAGLMQQAGGEEAGKQLVASLKANGLRVFAKNNETLAALQTREISLAIMQSSAALAAQKATPTLRIGFPAKTTLMPSCIGIPAHAPEPVKVAAQRFAAFALSQAGQTAMLQGAPGGDSYFWPVVTGVAPLRGMPALTDVPRQSLDATLWGNRERDITRWFAEQVAG